VKGYLQRVKVVVAARTREIARSTRGDFATVSAEHAFGVECWMLAVGTPTGIGAGHDCVIGLEECHLVTVRFAQPSPTRVATVVNKSAQPL